MFYKRKREKDKKVVETKMPRAPKKKTKRCNQCFACKRKDGSKCIHAPIEQLFEEKVIRCNVCNSCKKKEE